LKAFDAMTILTSKHVSATDPQKMQSIGQQIDAQRQQLRAKLDAYEPLVSDEKDRSMLAADRAATVQSAEIRDRVLALSRQNKKDEADALLNGAMADAIAHVETAIEAHRAYNGQLGKQGTERAQAIIDNANEWELASSLVVLGCVLGLGVLAARSITRPLARAVEFAHRVAEGDLTSRVGATTNDETGRLLRTLDEMNGNLKRIVTNVRGGSETIASATAQIAAGNLDLSAYRAAGVIAARNGRKHGATHFHGAAERGERAAGQYACFECIRCGARRQRRGGEGRGNDGADQRAVDQDSGYHRNDRRDRFPNQYSCLERGR
jgi:methyl-accepting chemotaxis protein